MNNKGTLSKLYKGVRIPWIKIILGGFLAVFNSLVILTQYENYMAIFTGTMKDLSPLFTYLIASFIQYILIFSSVISSIGLVSVVTGVRKKVWKKMVHLPVRTFEKETPEGMLSRITSDAEFASQPFTVVIVFLQILTYIMSMSATAPKDMKEALPLFIVTFILAIVCIVYGAKLTSKAVQALQNTKANQTANYGEKLADIKLIKASCAEEKIIEHCHELINKRYEAELQNAFAIALQKLSSNFTYIIIYSCAFLGGIIAISKGTINDVGPINAIYVFGMALELTLVALMEIPSLFANTIGGSKKLVSIFAMEEENIQIGSDVELTGDIKTENISFRYDEDIVIDNISTIIPEKKITAIVGYNGSGKSTLLKLIDRLYPLENGNLYIGESRSDTISLKSWRKAFGVVSQDPSLFSGTLKDNICYGLEKQLSDSELNNIIQKTNLTDIPLDEEIGVNGNKLSGGQKQKVAIARALAKNPTYLILDEATANLDSKTEAEVKAGLKELMKDRTVIMVAHNYSAIEDADNIIVLKDGKVEDSGNKEEVLKNNDYFKKLVLE